MSDLDDALSAGGIISQTDLQKALALGGEVQVDSNEGILSSTNKAIAETVGAPIDVAAAGLNLIPGVDIQEPFLGSESLKTGFRSLGIPVAGEEPADTTPERIGQGIGEAVSFMLPVAKAAQLASRGVGLVGSVSRSVWQEIVRHPFIAGASEVAGGAGTGLGRQFAEEVAPGDPLVRSLAEIVGGATTALAIPLAATNLPTVVGGRFVKDKVQKLSLPFSEPGSKYRAGKFIKGQVSDVERAAVKVTGETIGGLPPVVASGEKRLIAAWNQFRTLDPVTDDAAIEQLGKSIYRLELELRSHGFGAPEVLRNVTSKRVAALEIGMEKRVSDAMSNAQVKLDALPVAQRRSQESIIVRDALDGAMKKEFESTQVLWRDVPKEAQVDYTQSHETFNAIKNDLSAATKGDMPDVNFSAISELKDGGEFQSIKELQGLRSKLLQVQRNASAAGPNANHNMARIAGDMADVILNDMTTSGEDSVKIAIAATRQFKNRYEKGIVGKILGRDKSGAPAIDPSVTLDVSVGRGGTKGITLSAEDIDKVAVTPEALSATKRFISRSFTDYTTDRGTKSFNVNKADKWINQNEAILDKFPELREQMGDIASAKQFADNTAIKMETRRKNLQDPKISESARFLQSDPGNEVSKVFKSSNPTQRTEELIRQARKDPTGEALEGLEGSYIDHMINESTVGAHNEIGEQTLSGRAILRFMDAHSETLSKIITPEKLARINRVGKELALIELSKRPGVKAPSFAESDVLGNFMQTGARLAGVRVGRFISGVGGGGSDIQTPGIFSERFKIFAKHLNTDRAMAMIHDAITIDDGGKLLNALLLPIDKPATAQGAKNLRTLNTRMNAWLLGPGNRVLRDIEQEQSEDRGDLRLQRPEGSQSTLSPIDMSDDELKQTLNLR